MKAIFQIEASARKSRPIIRELSLKFVNTWFMNRQNHMLVSKGMGQGQPTFENEFSFIAAVRQQVKYIDRCFEGLASYIGVENKHFVNVKNQMFSDVCQAHSLKKADYNELLWQKHWRIEPS